MANLDIELSKCHPQILFNLFIDDKQESGRIYIQNNRLYKNGHRKKNAVTFCLLKLINKIKLQTLTR